MTACMAKHMCHLHDDFDLLRQIRQEVCTHPSSQAVRNLRSMDSKVRRARKVPGNLVPSTTKETICYRSLQTFKGGWIRGNIMRHLAGEHRGLATRDGLGLATNFDGLKARGQKRTCTFIAEIQERNGLWIYANVNKIKWASVHKLNSECSQLNSECSIKKSVNFE